MGTFSCCGPQMAPKRTGWDDLRFHRVLLTVPTGQCRRGTVDGTVVLRNGATGSWPTSGSGSNKPASLFGPAENLIVSTEDGGLWRWNVSLPRCWTAPAP